VTVLTRFLLLITAGLWMALPLSAQEPGRLDVESVPGIAPRLEPSANQKLADAIAEQLRQSGVLHHYTIDVVFRNGTAELNGTVADQTQHDEVLGIVRGVPAVERIIDHVVSADPGTLTTVQAVSPPVMDVAPKLAPNFAAGSQPQFQAGTSGPHDVSPQMMPPNGWPPYNYYSGPGANGAVEPQPQFQAGTPGPYDLNPPKMPPYAWPTYAPYNNYSRVAYPTLYPPQSWPFIGPLYPFPKVPLGWRAVKLEWQDGHWWLSRYATPHDWWLLKYW
jgi:BON domain